MAKKGAVAILNLDKLRKKLDVAGNIDPTPPVTYITLLVQQEARLLVRKRTRTLERSIDQKVTSAKIAHAAQGKVFTNVEYAAPLEFGVNKTYVIKPKDAKALFWEGANHPVKKVIMPPRKPYPFMKPAIKNNAAKARQIFKQYYKNELSKLRK